MAQKAEDLVNLATIGGETGQTDDRGLKIEGLPETGRNEYPGLQLGDLPVTGQNEDEGLQLGDLPEAAQNEDEGLELGDLLEAAQNEDEGLQLGDLPEIVIASVLRLTTPRDVARLACVNTVFLAASSSDVVWEAMLPPSYVDILAQAGNAPSRTRSKRELYQVLCNRVPLENGTEEFWLDRPTGAICRSIGARGLALSCSSSERYWTWAQGMHGSRYRETANLKLNVGNEAHGRLRGFLSAGRYTLSWRLLFESKLFTPVKFSIAVAGGKQSATRCFLTRRGARPGWVSWPNEEQKALVCRWDGNEWMEFDVGEFVVNRKDSPVDVRFSMTGLKSRVARSSLWLDGVVIRPSCLASNEESSKRQVIGYADDSWIDVPLCRRVRVKRKR